MDTRAVPNIQELVLTLFRVEENTNGQQFLDWFRLWGIGRRVCLFFGYCARIYAGTLREMAEGTPMNTCVITANEIIVTRHAAVREVGWNPPVSPTIQYFLCTACSNAIGNRRWANGWFVEDGFEFGMWLCEDCASQAEKYVEGIG